MNSPDVVPNPVPTPGREGGSDAVHFVSEAQKDLKLWLCMVLFFGVFRAVLILMFQHHLGSNASAWQVFKAFFNGARFDASVAAYWIMPCVLSSLWRCFAGARFSSARLRTGTMVAFLFSSLALCVVNAGYFAEYKNNFDQAIYGIVHDDQGAILDTIWQEYHVVPLILLILVGTAAGTMVAVRFVRRPFFAAGPSLHPALRQRHWTGCLVAFLAFAAARGSLGSAPWKYKDAAKATKDDFLNKIVLNPYVALKFAIQRHEVFGQPDGWKQILPQEDIRDAAAEFLPLAGTKTNLDECLERIAPGHNGPRPKHIFLVVMESYDAWTLLPAYQSLGVSRELGRLATNGIFVKAFVPAGNMTMISMDTILSGLPGAGLRQSYQLSSLHAFPTATAVIFKKLGYTTRFIKGGDPSWNRLGDFARDQGFDEVHTAHMMTVTGKPRDWGWGVDDEDMFRYAQGLLSDDRPSFNVILSVSNHKPYNLDVFGLGYPHQEIPPDLAGVWSGKISMQTIGHYWYADRALGRFVAAVEKTSPDCLFAITGDHWSRNFLNDHPTIYESTSVPLVLYGPEILRDVKPPPRMAGSHIDIAPTLVSLVAPAGFHYHSFGEDILAPRGEPVGKGQFAVITPNWIFRAGDPDHSQTLKGQPLNGPISWPALDPEEIPAERYPGPTFLARTDGLGKEQTIQFLSEISHLQRIETALGWWRLMKGNALPDGRHVLARSRPEHGFSTSSTR